MVVLAPDGGVVPEVEVAVDVDVADPGLGGKLGDGTVLAETRGIADIMVAAQADGEASPLHDLFDTSGNAFRGLHYVGGVDVVVADVDEAVRLREGEVVAGGDIEDAVGARFVDSLGHAREPSLMPRGPMRVPKRLVWVLSWGAPPMTTMSRSTLSRAT